MRLYPVLSYMRTRPAGRRAVPFPETSASSAVEAPRHAPSGRDELPALRESRCRWCPRCSWCLRGAIWCFLLAQRISFCVVEQPNTNTNFSGGTRPDRMREMLRLLSLLLSRLPAVFQRPGLRGCGFNGFQYGRHEFCKAHSRKIYMCGFVALNDIASRSCKPIHCSSSRLEIFPLPV